MTEPRVAGVELGGTKSIAVVAQGRNIIDRAQWPSGHDPAKTLAAIADWIENRQRTFNLAALGIASFGPLGITPASQDFGRILDTPKPGWSGTDVIGALSRGFDGPIGIHTDVAGAALAEGSWGASVDCYTHAYITIGTGIGGGIVIGGRPYAGIHHPEIGHIRVRRAPSDRFAGICPFHGDCLEGLASGPAIAARAGQPAEDLPADHPIWAPVTAEIAEMLCSLILTISPERIVLGGGVGFGQAWLLPRLRHATACLLNNYLPGHTEESLKGVIVPPSLGADAGVYGGVALAITALTKGL